MESSYATGTESSGAWMLLIQWSGARAFTRCKRATRNRL